MGWIEHDMKTFRERQKEIHDALDGKTGMVTKFTKQNVFYELCFVLCVPQSRAVAADNAIRDLRKNRFLTEKLANPVGILRKHGVRFHKNKAKYLMGVHALYRDKRFWKQLKIFRDQFDSCPPYSRIHYARAVRAWLVGKVKGLGYKTASQFLRNVGIKSLAILDVHVLDHLKARRLIEPIKSPTKKQYADIETIMKYYADTVNMTIEELDLLWWSNKTGFVLR